MSESLDDRNDKTVMPMSETELEELEDEEEEESD
jgi:hypothetical protein